MENPYQLRNKTVYQVTIKRTPNSKTDKRLYANKDEARRVHERACEQGVYSTAFYESGWSLYTHINYSL